MLKTEYEREDLLFVLKEASWLLNVADGEIDVGIGGGVEMCRCKADVDQLISLDKVADSNTSLSSKGLVLLWIITLLYLILDQLIIDIIKNYQKEVQFK